MADFTDLGQLLSVKCQDGDFAKMADFTDLGQLLSVKCQLFFDF